MAACSMFAMRFLVVLLQLSLTLSCYSQVSTHSVGPRQMETWFSEIRSAPAVRSRPAIKAGQQGIPAVTRGQYGIPNAAGQGHLQQGAQIWNGHKEVQATYARIQEAVCLVSL